jgi:hypothetical protein
MACLLFILKHCFDECEEGLVYRACEGKRKRERERELLAIMFIEGNSWYMGNIEIY